METREMHPEKDRHEMTVRLNADMYEMLRIATFELRISKQQAMNEAIELWLQSHMGISKELGRWLHRNKKKA